MPLLLCCLDTTSKPFSLALLLIITIKASSSIYWSGLTSLLHRSGLNNVLAHLRDLVLYLQHLLKSLCHLHFFTWGRVLASNSNYPLGHRKSKIIPEKHLLLLHWLCKSLWLCGSQQSVEDSSRDGNTRPPYLPLEKSVCSSRSNS